MNSPSYFADIFDDMNPTKLILAGALVVLIIAVVYLIMKKPAEPVENLSDSNYSSMPQQQLPPRARNMQRGVLVMFFAPWCGHCKNMEPVWDEFTQNFDGYNGIKILKINGQENDQLAQLHSVSGFPTIKYCPGGVEDPNGFVYEGDRSLDSLVQFLQQST